MFAKKFVFNPLCLSVMLMTGSIAIAQANVIADKNARQNLNVLVNANGSDTININAPSASGISHNKYTQFDVSGKGMILNNSKESSLTSVAGVIAGNRNLNNSAAARVILNEVTSNRASNLQGNLEVAGQKAHVIIANPNGITCNGCDFINTSRNTLTTGRPVMQRDDLLGFDVKNGTITVSSKGMKDNFSAYTDLIARYIKVQGRVEANNLTLMSGVNEQISIEDNQVVAKGASLKGMSEVGIDVSNLGSMYANKITLIANNDGVGVRHAGNIQSQGDLFITSRGDISSQKGIIQAASNIDMDADGNITHTQGIITAQNLHIAANKIQNSGHIQASDTALLNANEIKNNDGIIQSLHDLNIQAESIANTQTGAVSRDDFSLNKGIISGGDMTITASNVKNSSQMLSMGGVTIAANSMDNKNGNIVANGDISLNINGELSAANSVIAAGNDVNIQAATLNNTEHNSLFWGFINTTTNKAGLISAENNINYHVKDTVDNYNNLLAKNSINITSGDNFNNHATVNGSNIAIQAKGIYNAGEIEASNKFEAEGSAHFTNAGKVTASHSVLISAPEVNNKGEINSASTKIYAPVFKNTGTMQGSFNVVSSLKPQEPQEPSVTPQPQEPAETTRPEDPALNPISAK
ncbi:filamentous hemagglutinin N-terminal domain-containing protein [Pantoea alhagi]|uniref:filamentous hemagglutinin N-terminal domain-containing protein n=1 Tax=Pantoea alhagi TaxID=1891675 RepID=UPI00202B38EC|nr:filamentous hemagglutinin N-terminal domain-containing protein [Pantoea alhagi]URQ60269.1 filamentous hemagglutinin N-terminal domain-containing protein [Pantoea alhagi]